MQVEVVSGTDISALAPSFTLSEGAISSPASGETINFSNPVVITVTAEDNETTQDWTVTISVTDIITSTEIDMEFQIYPNPVENTLHIEAPESMKVQLTDLNGRKVLDQKTGKNIEINMAGLKPGTYLLTIWKGDRQITRKII